MCAEHGQCIHPWYRLGIPCIECEMAKCSRERGTWNWPFYLPHLHVGILHSVPPPMLLSLDFVGDSPFSVYSPALPSNLLTPGNTCVSGPQHDKKPTCRRTFSARAQRSPAASWRLSAMASFAPSPIADGLTIRSSEHPSSVPPVLFIQLYSTTDSLLRCQLLLDPAG